MVSFRLKGAATAQRRHLQCHHQRRRAGEALELSARLAGGDAAQAAGSERDHL